MTVKDLAAGLREVAHRKGYTKKSVRQTFPSDTGLIKHVTTCLHCGRRVIDKSLIPGLIEQAHSADEFLKLVDKHKSVPCN